MQLYEWEDQLLNVLDIIAAFLVQLYMHISHNGKTLCVELKSSEAIPQK